MAKNELMKLCDDLEKGCSKKLCDKNEIVCVKSELQKRIGCDKNKYLKIKAQIKKYNIHKTSIIDYMIKLISVFTFSLTIIHNVSEENKIAYALYALMALFVLAVLSILNLFYSKKDAKKQNWICLIDIALEDIARENKWI